MAELHRNDKLKILAVLVIIACFFFVRILFYFLVGIAIVGIFLYLVYKSIAHKVGHLGDRPQTRREKFKADVRRAKARMGR